MKEQWHLSHRRELWGIELGQDDVSFPTQDAQGNAVDVSDYLKLEATVNGKRQEFFLRTISPRRARSDVIYVSMETAAQIPDGTEVTVSPASVEGFRWYVLRHSEDQKLALYGLILAVAGVVMGAVLTVAQVAGFSLGLPTTVTLEVLSAVLEIVGLALVFWRGLLGAR